MRPEHVRHYLTTLDRFLRLHFVGFTAMWALLGAFSSDPGLGLVPALAITALGVSFHVYGGVLNDLVDLPIDRTQPLRAGDALVTGRVSSRGASLLVAAQVPIMTVIALLFAGSSGVPWLAAAVLAMTVYNLFGKRCPWPWLTDAAQGTAWWSLTYLGATMAAGPNVFTALLALYGFLYVMLVNGIHGGLRDLENDQAHGASTMALWLGARAMDDGGIALPRRTWWYCFGMLGLLSALSLALVGAAGHPAKVFWVVTTLVVLTNGALFRMMPSVLRPDRRDWSRSLRLHVGLLLAPMLIAALSALPWGPATYVLVTFVAPLMLLEVVQELVQPPRTSG